MVFLAIVEICLAFWNEIGVRIAFLAPTFRHGVRPELGNLKLDTIKEVWLRESDSRAISLSWCGNERSIPPEWMSILSPNLSTAIAEHSMCYTYLW